MKSLKGKTPLLLAGLFAMSLLAACATAVKVSSDEARNAPPAELQRGKTLYLHACKLCHDIIEPAKHSVNEWHAAVRTYGPRSKLSREQRHAVLTYLVWAKESGSRLADELPAASSASAITDDLSKISVPEGET